MSNKQTSAPKHVPSGLYEHRCEHAGCKKDGGWGFATGKQAPRFARKARTGDQTSDPVTP